MNAGRELDALIAQKILGLNVVITTWGSEDQYSMATVGEPDRCYTADEPGGIVTNYLPSYSEDIAAAWEVVEQMRSLGFYMTLEVELGDTYWVQFYSATSEALPTAETQSSAPLAICLAALKTLEKK